ncbi:MAG TPA: sugar transferase [Allosphingosinicella sp.]|nr:sugar transferase [Allosphingosinicella sp.]
MAAEPGLGDLSGYVIVTPDERTGFTGMAWRVEAECRNCGVPLRLGADKDVYFAMAKPVLDWVAAALLLVVLAPLFLLVAMLIKLSDGGPVFFAQPRTGYMARRFRLIKFRTMIPGAERERMRIWHLNMHGDGTPDFKAKDDPRVTRLGRYLRLASLDELPNLFNVLRGEMSLVGPRPTSFDAATYSPCHLARLAVKPGITGLWQVSGRASIDFNRRCELDKEYIRTASAAVDGVLLIKTVGAVLRRNGAH